MALRVPGMIKLALCTAYGALQRTESRGAHTREDFPARNDAEWLTRTLAYWKEGDSLPTLKYEDASPWFELPPGERGYGGGKIEAGKRWLSQSGADPKTAVLIGDTDHDWETADALGCRCGSCFHVIWNQEREAAGLDQKMSEDTSASVKVAVEGLKRLIEADRKAGR